MSEYDLVEYSDIPEEEPHQGTLPDMGDALPEWEDFFVDDLDQIREIDIREITGESYD